MSCVSQSSTRRRHLPTLIAVVPQSLDEYFKEAIFSISSDFVERIVYGCDLQAFQTEIDRTDNAEYVFAVASPVAYDVLEEFTNKRCKRNARIAWVHSLLTGIDAYKPRDLKRFLTAPMSNARGSYASILAEHVAMSCLYFNKQVARLQHNHIDKNWCRFANNELRGKVVGIVGYGNIGRAVARTLEPFGVHLIGFRNNKDRDFDDIGVRQYNTVDELGQLLQESDFVVAILPQTPATENFFRTKHFNMMKKSAVFINIGRGSTVQEDELFDALESGTIAGAALDVFRKEPLPSESKLWSLSPNKILLSSHNADISVEAFVGAAQSFVKFFHDFVEFGKTPDYLVDLSKGY